MSAKWDGLIVAKYDQLMRSVLDFLTLRKWLTDYGKTVIWIDLPPDFSTPFGKGMANVLITFEDDGAGVGAVDLPSLSHRFGEVEKFATRRFVKYQEWQRWAGGSPVRRYCRIGESGQIRVDEVELMSADGNLLRAAGLAGGRDAFDVAAPGCKPAWPGPPRSRSVVKTV